jgi:NADP-dependent 3-hydroxy acid dehydrogenase YdfG
MMGMGVEMVSETNGAAEDAVLLITGASSGIGMETARQAAAAGYRVAVAARSADRLQVLASELGGPERAIAIPCDVCVWEDNQAAVAETLAAFGRLDAVYANAAMLCDPGWKTGSVEAWRDMVLTNVYGPALTVRAAYDAIVASQGRFLLTASRAAHYPIAGSLYGATKSAVLAMGEALRLEFNDTGVRVTVITPGWVATPMWNEEPPAGALVASDVAQAVVYVLGQPARVDINEILIRPTIQPT